MEKETRNETFTKKRERERKTEKECEKWKEMERTRVIERSGSIEQIDLTIHGYGPRILLLVNCLFFSAAFRESA